MERNARGLVTDTSSGEWGRATATFSADRTYRYELTRVWGDGAVADLRLVNFLMLNPSTADAFVLDPTNRRCVGFAREWGYDGLVTTNVFAHRSTSPSVLRRIEDPVGPANDETILRAARSSSLVIAAWGVHATLGGRDRVVRESLEREGIELHALRRTRDGHPGHPLYVAAATRPMRWP